MIYFYIKDFIRKIFDGTAWNGYSPNEQSVIGFILWVNILWIVISIL